MPTEERCPDNQNPVVWALERLTAQVKRLADLTEPPRRIIMADGITEEDIRGKR